MLCLTLDELLWCNSTLGLNTGDESTRDRRNILIKNMLTASNATDEVALYKFLKNKSNTNNTQQQQARTTTTTTTT